MTYHGGINFQKFYDRVMTCKADEVAGIRKEFEDLIQRQKETEQQEKKRKAEQAGRRIRNELKVHPQVVIQGDY